MQHVIGAYRRCIVTVTATPDIGAVYYRGFIRAIRGLVSEGELVVAQRGAL